MLHFIAYRDQTGGDCNGLPWVRIVPDDIEVAKELHKKMCQEYKDVVLAECDDDEFARQESIGWKFSYDHQIL